MYKSIILVVLAAFLGLCVADNKLPLVLVHGAGVSGAAWEPLKPLLQAPSVYNPTQRGRAGSSYANQDPATITFQNYIDDITTVVNSADKGDGVILIGHSFGGLLVSQVGENLGPNKVRAIIYVASYIPATGTAAGDNFNDHLAADTASVIPQYASFDPVNKTWVTITNASAVFLNDCPNNDATTAQANTIEAIREPTAPFATNVTYSANNFGKIPKYFITTALDTAVTPGFQNLEYTHLRMENITGITAGHAPMFCDPQALADIINSYTPVISDSALHHSSSSSVLVAGGLALVAAIASLL